MKTNCAVCGFSFKARDLVDGMCSTCYANYCQAIKLTLRNERAQRAAANLVEGIDNYVEVDGDPDASGRQRFTAYWRSPTAPSGVSGQVFHCSLQAFLHGHSTGSRVLVRTPNSSYVFTSGGSAFCI